MVDKCWMAIHVGVLDDQIAARLYQGSIEAQLLQNVLAVMVAVQDDEWIFLALSDPRNASEDFRVEA